MSTKNTYFYNEYEVDYNAGYFYLWQTFCGDLTVEQQIKETIINKSHFIFPNLCKF
jgi:hypothetical protein